MIEKSRLLWTVSRNTVIKECGSEDTEGMRDMIEKTIKKQVGESKLE